jgi:hypothetical protein
MTKLKKFIVILHMAICCLLYKHTDIEIDENETFIKIVKITFWGK